jgi:hypothetical protein
VKNRFQSLPFKCNLQRYNEARERMTAAAAAGIQSSRFISGGGLYKSNPLVTCSLCESGAWFLSTLEPIK